MLRVYTQTNLRRYLNLGSPLEIQNFDVNDIVLFTLLTLHYGTVLEYASHSKTKMLTFSVPSVGVWRDFKRGYLKLILRID